MNSDSPVPSPGASAGLLVVGLGGAGLAALRRLAADAAGLGDDTAFIAIETDSASLARRPEGVEGRLAGTTVARGWGCGGDPVHGAAALEGEEAWFRARIAGVRVVCLLAGLGGGTGGGGAPFFARLARESGAFVIVFGLTAAEFEGERRRAQSLAALRALRESAHAVIAQPLEGLLRLQAPGAAFETVRDQAEELLAQPAGALLGALRRTSFTGVSPGDIERVLRDHAGTAVAISARASGPGRVESAVASASTHPFLAADPGLPGAAAVIAVVSGGTDLQMDEVNRAAELLRAKCPSAEVIATAGVRPALGDQLEVAALVVTPASLAPESSETPRTGVDAAMKFEDAMPPGGLPAPQPAGFVPAPPDLTPEQRQRVVETQFGRRKSKGKSPLQTTFNFEVVSIGRFQQTEPTLRRGQNLDEPTWARRGLTMN
jgi:cell division protein FtsZ